MFIVAGDGSEPVEAFSLAEREWEDLPEMPREAYKGAAVVERDGKLLVIGGHRSSYGSDDDRYSDDGVPNDDEVLSDVLEYDPEKHSWRELPSLLTARTWCAAAVLGGDVVVMGGRDHSGKLASVERYNRQSQCWEAMADLPVRFSSPAAVVVRVCNTYGVGAWDESGTDGSDGDS